MTIALKRSLKPWGWPGLSRSNFDIHGAVRKSFASRSSFVRTRRISFQLFASCSDKIEQVRLPQDGQRKHTNASQYSCSTFSFLFDHHPGLQRHSFSTASLASNSDFHLEAPSSPPQVCILYATTGGTAELFATQLAQAIEEQVSIPAEVKSLGDYASLPQLLSEQKQNQNDGDSSSECLYLFLVSTAGVGEPPSSAKAFYDDLINNSSSSIPIGPQAQSLQFAIFGLGNKKAHPNHYNVVSKKMQARLEESGGGGGSVLPLTLGDDGDCIDDDFDQWQDKVIKYLQQHHHHQVENETTTTTTSLKETSSSEAAAPTPIESDFPSTMACPGAVSGERIVSSRYPMLKLRLDESLSLARKAHKLYDLLDIIPEWYQAGTQRYLIHGRTLLNRNAVANGLTELEIDLSSSSLANNNNNSNNHNHRYEDNDSDTSYKAGDHFVVYPRNADFIVDAYLNYVQVKPDASIITDDENNEGRASSYPHPKGLTVYETLSFCVDLGATPSPQFVRMMIANSKNNNRAAAVIQNYKDQVATPRRTTLDLALELEAQLSLEDVLYNLPPLQPRYYSIASSPLRTHNDTNTKDPVKTDRKSTLLLTYRSIRYLTSRGVLRDGICTSYMDHLSPVVVGDCSNGSSMAGAIRSNPSFRLPSNPDTSVVMIAGGCGVAPVRSFLEERLLLHQQQGTQFGKALLFLGFRDMDDVVYVDLIEQCLSTNVLSTAHISSARNGVFRGNESTDTSVTPSSHSMISWTGGNVTDSLDNNSDLLWNHFQQGGHTYVCGGALSFGAALRAGIVSLIQKQGNMSVEDASNYLRKMVAEGRFAEDLSD